MIDKNYDAISAQFLNSVDNADDNMFWDSIDKEKKNKEELSGEGLTIKMFTYLQGLYKNRFSPEEMSIKKVNKKNHFNISSLVTKDRLKYGEKNDSISFSVTNKYSISISPREEKALSFTSATDDAVDQGLNATMRSSENDDRFYESDSTKINLAGQLKNHTVQQCQEVPRQDRHVRRETLLDIDNKLRASRGMMVKSTVGAKKTLSIDYPFLRWAGEHSVKISIPTGIYASKHLTLLPSDIYAAEIISRQVNQLNGFTTELLHSQDDEEDSKQQHQRFSREDEK